MPTTSVRHLTSLFSRSWELSDQICFHRPRLRDLIAVGERPTQVAFCDLSARGRLRARTRRYCCDQCNDRASIAAYRRRESTKHN